MNERVQHSNGQVETADHGHELLAHPKVAAVVLTDSAASPATLTAGTHYTIDTDQGDSVEIVEESSIGEGLKKGEKVLLKVKKEKINVFTKDGDTNLIRSDAYEKQ